MEPRFSLVVFDLDGTLVDSRRDLDYSVNALLAEYGAPPLSEHLVGTMVAEYEIRRHRRYLMGASDHILKDIGLARSEIDRAVRFGHID